MTDSIENPEEKKAENSVSPSRHALFFLRRIRDVEDSAKALMQTCRFFMTIHNTTPSAALAQGVQFTFAAMDFFLIPSIYLIAYLLKEESLCTLENNIRWVHACVLVTLGLLALTIPPLAAALMLVSATISLGFNMGLLIDTLHDRYQLERTCKPIGLEGSEALGEQKKTLHKKIIDRLIGVGLATLGVGGTVLFLFFPLVGLGILTGISIMTLAYIAASWMYTEATNADPKNNKPQEGNTTLEIKLHSTHSILNGLERPQARNSSVDASSPPMNTQLFLQCTPTLQKEDELNPGNVP